MTYSTKYGKAKKGTYYFKITSLSKYTGGTYTIKKL